MRTALDTNVISALLTGESNARRIAKTLRTCRYEGQLPISGPVYCEAAANPYVPEDGLNQFLAEENIAVDWTITERMWAAAAAAFRLHVQRRREGGGSPRRLLADFIIGAYAAYSVERLFTFDTSLFKTYFPSLTLIQIEPRH